MLVPIKLCVKEVRGYLIQNLFPNQCYNYIYEMNDLINFINGIRNNVDVFFTMFFFIYRLFTKNKFFSFMMSCILNTFHKFHTFRKFHNNPALTTELGIWVACGCITSLNMIKEKLFFRRAVSGSEIFLRFVVLRIFASFFCIFILIILHLWFWPKTSCSVFMCSLQLAFPNFHLWFGITNCTQTLLLTTRQYPPLNFLHVQLSEIHLVSHIFYHFNRLELETGYNYEIDLAATFWTTPQNRKTPNALALCILHPVN